MCEHKEKLEVTEFGDPNHRYRCSDCGAAIDGEPFSDPDVMTMDQIMGDAPT